MKTIDKKKFKGNPKELAPFKIRDKQFLKKLCKYITPIHLLRDLKDFKGLVSPAYVTGATKFYNYLKAEFPNELFDYQILAHILYEFEQDFVNFDAASIRNKEVSPYYLDGASDFMKVIEVYKKQHMNITGITFCVRPKKFLLDDEAVLKMKNIKEMRKKTYLKDETVKIEGLHLIQKIFNIVIEGQKVFEKFAKDEKILNNEKNKDLKDANHKAKFRLHVSKVLYKFLKENLPSATSEYHIYVIGGKLNCILGLLPDIPASKVTLKQKNDFYRSNFYQDIKSISLKDSKA
jgi:hypothetical protein